MSPATRRRPRTGPALRRRRLLNLVNLTTPLGLTVARIGGARLRPGPDGLVLGEGYRLSFPVAGAFTLGNVVTTASTMTELGPGVLGHEDRHAWQYSRWGLAFLPAYAAAAGWSWLRYGDPASGNPFERGAGLVSGRYLTEGASRPARRSLRSGAGAAARAARAALVAVARPRQKDADTLR